MRRETFSTPEPPRLRINLAAGLVKLETAETSETKVDLDGPNEEAAVIELRGHELVVDVERRRGLGGGRGHELSICGPHGSAVEVTTASADVDGNGWFSTLDAKTASGDVAFEHLQDEAKVKTASGDVILKAVGGALDVNAASGDVIVGEAESNLRVQTASGDQQIGSVVQGEVTLQTASGDITVGIRRGSKLWVDATSMSGDTASELELTDTPSDSGGPLVELRAKSMSGDVSIRRA
jgi:hypothetical protein